MSLALAGRTRTIRRLAATLHHGLVVLTIAEEGVYYRQKGRRKQYLLPHGAAFQYAVELHVERERANRPKKKRSRPRRKR